jgi:hypothetical protein
MRDPAHLPTYALPGTVLRDMTWAAFTGRTRSCAHDAGAVAAKMAARLRLTGTCHIPQRGAYLITCNHYTRPGLGAWAFTAAISATIAAHRAPESPADVHWIITEAWRYPDWRRYIVTPLTRWAFAQIAGVYGFVTMPPMPPAPEETAARAIAVRRALRLARQLSGEHGLLGLAPEGKDTLEIVGKAPPGAGDFIALLVGTGLGVLPVAVTETNDLLHISFGAPFTPEIPHRHADRDRVVIEQVMDAIAAQLPAPAAPERLEKYDFPG